MDSVVLDGHPGIAVGRLTAPLGAPRWLRLLCVTAMELAVTASICLGVGVRAYQHYREPTVLPHVPPRPLFSTLFDGTPIAVMTTRHWMKFQIIVPRFQFLSDHTIWRQMYFEDWDRLDTAIWREGLIQVLDRYGHRVADTRLWPQMSAHEWDEVPQPVRAMAFVGMIEHWVRYYQVGVQFDLDPGLVLRTSKAIAMAESWFDHRAVHINRDGSRDIGIGGASDFARSTLRRSFDRGLADFTMSDQDYFNPWLASRWLAFWLDLTLREVHGDLDLAIRTYNVGLSRAVAGAGADYLEAVERRRRRYFEGPSDSPTWSTLSQYRRDGELPWCPCDPSIRASQSMAGLLTGLNVNSRDDAAAP